ncbi:hypothetical protein FE374_07470 [Georgenia yuyongxinii]|uniref:DUF4190 domain-containing protein n=1 Tax=Georgenia yuyongxinii TaxID=2589797 RepID=A0A5B8C569_9MICO|nr:hypothetical protein [Georgenia yuyongxinii]QDC24485.1 hypothetical protein FE374_07470 [Georgenia yuyongxinii]
MSAAGEPPFGEQPGYNAGQYGPGQYGAAVYGAAGPSPYGWGGASTEQNNLGVIALVAAIVGVVASFIPGVNLVAPIGGIVGIVVGIMSVRAAAAGRATNRGMGVAGIVVGAVQLLLLLLLLLLLIIGAVILFSSSDPGFSF